MSRVFASEIDREHSAVSFDHEFLTILRGRNLNVDVETLYTVGTIRHGSDDDSSYLLAVVSHLKAPLDEVDVVNASIASMRYLYSRTTVNCNGPKPPKSDGFGLVSSVSGLMNA